MRTVRHLHHEDDAIAWRFLRASPGPALAPHIAGYTDYVEVASGPVRRRELPETGVVMIVNLGAPLTVADPRDPSTRHAFPSAFLAGLTDSYTLTETTGSQSGVQVNLTPLGARRIFGLDLSDLTNRIVPLEDIAGAPARRLIERLAEAPVGEARWRILDDELGAWSGRGRESAPEVRWAVRELAASRGRVAVGRLAETLGWSRARLVAAFREEIGFAPKRMARLFRFRHALECLERGVASTTNPPTGLARSPDWTGIAYGCGYSDQSHMIREFHEFAGLAPSAFVRHRLPNEGGLADG